MRPHEASEFAHLGSFEPSRFEQSLIHLLAVRAHFTPVSSAVHQYTLHLSSRMEPLNDPALYVAYEQSPMEIDDNTPMVGHAIAVSPSRRYSVIQYARRPASYEDTDLQVRVQQPPLIPPVPPPLYLKRMTGYVPPPEEPVNYVLAEQPVPQHLAAHEAATHSSDAIRYEISQREAMEQTRGEEERVLQPIYSVSGEPASAYVDHPPVHEPAYPAAMQYHLPAADNLVYEQSCMPMLVYEQSCMPMLVYEQPGQQHLDVPVFASPVKFVHRLFLQPDANGMISDESEGIYVRYLRMTAEPAGELVHESRVLHHAPEYQEPVVTESLEAPSGPLYHPQFMYSPAHQLEAAQHHIPLEEPARQLYHLQLAPAEPIMQPESHAWPEEPAVPLYRAEYMYTGQSAVPANQAMAGEGRSWQVDPGGQIHQPEFEYPPEDEIARSQQHCEPEYSGAADEQLQSPRVEPAASSPEDDSAEEPEEFVVDHQRMMRHLACITSRGSSSGQPTQFFPPQRPPVAVVRPLQREEPQRTFLELASGPVYAYIRKVLYGENGESGIRHLQLEDDDESDDSDGEEAALADDVTSFQTLAFAAVMRQWSAIKRAMGHPFSPGTSFGQVELESFELIYLSSKYYRWSIYDNESGGMLPPAPVDWSMEPAEITLMRLLAIPLLRVQEDEVGDGPDYRQKVVDKRRCAKELYRLDRIEKVRRLRDRRRMMWAA